MCVFSSALLIYAHLKRLGFGSDLFWVRACFALFVLSVSMFADYSRQRGVDGSRFVMVALDGHSSL